MEVRVDVTNTGDRTGDEVVQLYVSFPESAVERPIQDLRGFDRITLAPGETKTVRLIVDPSDLAYWDPDEDRWVTEQKPVLIRVGASSDDIRLEELAEIAE